MIIPVFICRPIFELKYWLIIPNIMLIWWFSKLRNSAKVKGHALLVKGRMAITRNCRFKLKPWTGVSGEFWIKTYRFQHCYEVILIDFHRIHPADKIPHSMFNYGQRSMCSCASLNLISRDLSSNFSPSVTCPESSTRLVDRDRLTPLAPPLPSRS